MMHRQEKEMTNKSGRQPLQRVSTNDEAVLLLRDRQQAAISLNNLLQKAMGDRRVADTYQAFRVRYLRALGKFRPAEYEETEEMMEIGDMEAIRQFLRKLRLDEKDKKEHCSQLQNAWLLYDTLATDKPELLSAEEQQIEEEMDEFEEELFEEWHDFAEEVIARAEFEGDDDPDIGDWHLELKEIRKDLKSIKRRNAERDEMRKRALQRVRDMVRARRGEDVSETVHDDDDDDCSDDKSKKTTKTAKTAKSSKTKSSKKKKSKKEKRSDSAEEESSDNDLNVKSSHTTSTSSKRKKKSDKDKKSSKKSSKKKEKSRKKSSDNDSDDKLLEEVFPPHIARALREGRKVEPESKECVTIFFSDIVGFTNISATISPLKVSDMLDRLVSSAKKTHAYDICLRRVSSDRLSITSLTTCRVTMMCSRLKRLATGKFSKQTSFHCDFVFSESHPTISFCIVFLIDSWMGVTNLTKVSKQHRA